ncbi:23S rRNA (pseudouridine(1915)-N(3))-methyltransferase RlmH [bacterium AH-315-B15]|nr:23S rRNA (pseudouridine(1915)-N(3))-methyltransferase RlmH [bacterium AH-315-B15]
MKIKILFLGKTTQSFVSEGEAEYLKRLGKYLKVERTIIPEPKNAAKLSPNELKKAEGELILKNIEAGSIVVLLDEKGDEFTSRDFANWLQKRINQGPKSITFIVGGAYGFSDEVYKMASHKVALSQMTFSHQMVRVIFLEQLYRAFSILNNEPYHHD